MQTDSNIFGCYVSSTIGKSTDSENIKNEFNEQGKISRIYIFGESGLSQILKKLRKEDYGNDLALILFEFYVNPLDIEIEKLKEIGNYRKKEKSIGIPIKIDKENFFSKNDEERKIWIRQTIINRINLLDKKVKANKLDTNLSNLKKDVIKLLT